MKNKQKYAIMRVVAVVSAIVALVFCTVSAFKILPGFTDYKKAEKQFDKILSDQSYSIGENKRQIEKLDEELEKLKADVEAKNAQVEKNLGHVYQ